MTDLSAREPSTPADRRRPGLDPATWSVAAVLGFLAAHAALGLAVDAGSSAMATVHALIAGAGAIALSLGSRRVDLILMSLTYVGLSDVLWRMAGAAVPWEVAKWILVVGAAAAAARCLRPPRRLGASLALLIAVTPAVVTVVLSDGLDHAREAVSFNLGGLIALAALAGLTGNLAIRRNELRGLAWVAIGPVVAVTTAATAGTVGAEISFSATVSTVATSGGFGPNQVSTVIGFGIVIGATLLAVERRLPLRLAAGAAMVWFLGQAVLTFSRGGVVNVALAAVAAGLATGQARQLFRLAVGAAAFAIVALVLVFPGADDVTDGAASERFTSTHSTGRGELAAADLELFRRHPVFGTGVGAAPAERSVDRQLASHTEQTRLLAEHGAFGLAVLVVMVAMAVSGVARQTSARGRAYSAALAVWAFAAMTHSATRVAAVPLALALAQLVLLPDPDDVGGPAAPRENAGTASVSEGTFDRDDRQDHLHPHRRGAGAGDLLVPADRPGLRPRV